MFQFLDNSGLPVPGCKLYTYSAGTTTPLATYSDSAGTPNANQVVCDSAGRATVYLFNVSYKFVLKTSADVTLWTRDNVATLNSLVSAALGGHGIASMRPRVVARGNPPLQCPFQFLQLRFNEAASGRSRKRRRHRRLWIGSSSFNEAASGRSRKRADLSSLLSISSQLQ